MLFTLFALLLDLFHIYIGVFPIAPKLYLVQQKSALTQKDAYVVGAVIALLGLAGGIALALQSDQSQDVPEPSTSKGLESTSAADTKNENSRECKNTEKQAPKVISEVAEKSQKDTAEMYDKSRAEVQEIARIKNDFIAKLEKAGRQSTLRLETMGGSPIPGAEAGADVGQAANNVGSKDSIAGDSLPEEVLLRTVPMNLAKRNALEANRRQWGIGYDAKRPERIDNAQMSAAQ